jgi:fructokinase
MKRTEKQFISDVPEVVGEVRPVPVLVFGEVLFDCFPGGRRVLGGAPFNVAWGLKGFGRDPVLVSAVGEDADGGTVREKMAAWGLRTDGLQTDPDHATGKVQVEFNNSEPSYDICMPRAWDFIRDDGHAAARVLCHGLLALRSETSRRALEAIRARSPEAIRFFDINLRPPHDSRDRLREWMRGADWLKLNIDELTAVTGAGRVRFAESAGHIDRLREELGIRNVLVTAGAEGLRIRGEYGDAVCSPAPPLETLADTVGAGDSISAVAIDGILRGAPAREIVEAAGRFASRICGLHGAITEDKEFYRHE